MQSLHIIVIGGGAAGFMGAITAAETFPEATVTVLEKSKSVLNKVRISGGGRCNVTNAAPTLPELLKGYPRGAKLLRPLFELFNNQHTIEWFESRGVSLKTEPDGRMFPATNDSETIIDCLIKSAQRVGVHIRTGAGVTRLASKPEGFDVILQSGEILHADRILVTTGGHPQLTGYDWLSDLGVEVVPPVPSLFTFNIPASPLKDLMGVSVGPVGVKMAGSKLADSGPLLFTHWGISGPAVLRLSAWGARELSDKNYQFVSLVNFTNQKPNEIAQQLNDFQRDSAWRNKYVATQAPFGLPQRLWKQLTELSHIPDTMRWTDLPAKNLNRLVEQLTNFQLNVQGKTTFKEEFVTCGGVQLNGLHPKTLESRPVPGLFFAGEVLDIDGITGGYNFQAAWTTGYVAGSQLLSGITVN
ncbi:MAG: NAD(P)/FAD-dependent oxidoreductase [Spirosomataceae bacterium]